MPLPNKCHDRQLTAVDLFAGGGGLTVGLKNAGFQVAAAVELNPSAFSTYKANHPEVATFKQDIRSIEGKSLLNLCRGGSVDLLAGCPPCQGFCSLTAKYHRDDPRNELVGEMARLIRELHPKAVMMENVPGLASRGWPKFKELLGTLEQMGYIPSWKVLEVADYGVPQRRKRLVLLAGRGFSIPLPEPTHSRNGDKGLQKWKTVGEVIRRMPEPVTMSQASARGGAKSLHWHVVSDLGEVNRRRLELAIPGEGWTEIPENLRPKCHRGAYDGFSNVYGRMRWDEPSPTITGGCTTPSRGRFGHPESLRTISVREAALLQTFPIDYIIDADCMLHACNIIGNALPCDFAEVLARRCLEAMVEIP
jgi:DNA (cytosine-5)-methyltransferase 1